MGRDGGAERRIARLSWPAQQDRWNAGDLRRMLEAAGGCWLQPRDFAHDAREAAVAQAFLKHEGHCLRRFHMQHAVRVQAGAGQGGREEISPLHSP